MSGTDVVCAWAVGAELGEGPVWDCRSNAVYFVDIKGRRIHRLGAQGDTRSWAAPGQVGFIVPATSGGFVCGLQGGLYHFCERSGKFTLLHDVERALPHNRLNDGYVDQHGCLWFGSMDDEEQSPSGALYRLAGAGPVALREAGIIITNGPACSPDGRILYHTDTLARTVSQFDLHADGTVSNQRVFVTIAGSGYPDGMAVDAAGCVWIALFGGGRIERYSQAGQLMGSVAFPCSNVTKLAFGGADLRTVHVTTAWKGLTRAQRAREPLAGALFSFRAASPGLAPYAFDPGVSL